MTDTREPDKPQPEFHVGVGMGQHEMRRRAIAYSRLIEALRDSSMWLRVVHPSLPNTVVEDQNKATGELLKTRGLADVVKAVEESNAALLRELGEEV